MEGPTIMLDEKGKAVFHRRKLKTMMSDAGVRTYKQLAKLAGYCEATVRQARTEGKGVPVDTARTIVQALLRETKRNGDKTNGDKTNGDKTNGDKTNGDKTNGDKTNGDKTNGDKTNGDKTNGDKTNGDKTNGDKTVDDWMHELLIPASESEEGTVTVSAAELNRILEACAGASIAVSKLRNLIRAVNR